MRQIKNNIKNKAFHNLCITQTPPTGFGETVGLGLKFCIRTRRPENKVDNGKDRFIRDLRLKSYFGTDDSEEDSEDKPPPYVKSDWNPPPACRHIERRAEKFWATLQDLHNATQSSIGSNLTRFQYDVIKEIKNNKLLIVRPADKNLGLCAMDLDTYVDRALKDHLLSDAYQQLSDEEAIVAERKSHSHLTHLIWEKHKNYFANKTKEDEYKYFERSLKSTVPRRRPLFYVNPKLHKKPYSTRPVVSCVNSTPEIFSIWVDYWLKQLTHLAKSYLIDSTQAVEELKAIGRLPPGTRIFTADAVSMYTNIDTQHGITTIRNFLLQHKDELPFAFPSDLLVEVLKEIMTNNIFDFGDTHWIQLSGTAMGTSCACMYATLYYAHHENNNIIPQYSNRLKYYRRFIDDGIGIWVPLDDGNDATEWENFKNELNNFGKLEWECTKLSESVDFLDLTITIVNGKIEFKTYQKPLNLYQYIPPQSAHPPGMLKGLIIGNVGRYYIQNTHLEDYKSIVLAFYHRLRDRGYTHEKLEPLFIEANSRAQTGQKTTPPKKVTKESIFVHLQYHPQGVSRQMVRKAYEETCNKPNYWSDGYQEGMPCEGGMMRITNMTVAYSRPRNISDAITSSKLPDVEDHRVSEIINRLKEN